MTAKTPLDVQALSPFTTAGASLDRRGFIAGAGAVVTGIGVAGLAAMPHSARAATSGVRAAALDFLKALPPAQAKAVRFAFGGRTHRNWNFMGTQIKPGLPLEQMGKAAREAGYRLIAAGLSKAGFDKVDNIMATQDVMRTLGQGPKTRNRERFSIALFGEPSGDAGQDKLWGVRIEGHHLSVSWTLRGDDLVAVTPASFSVIPQHVPVGSLKGLTILQREEEAARRLITSLRGAKRARAIFSERKPGNVLAQAGSEDMFKKPEGLAVADMPAAERDLLWELVEATAVEPWPAALQGAQQKRIREGDRQAAHFAWAGGLEPGAMFYYRIHGETFVLEFTNVFGNPEHMHAIYHDPERTLGRHLAG